MKNKLLLVSVFALVFSSLMAQQTSIQGAEISKYEATQISNNGNLFIVPIAADLQVLSNEPKEYKLTENMVLPEMYKKEKEAAYLSRIKKYIDDNIIELKARALFEFIDQSNASLIISPIYSVRTLRSSGLNVTVEVRVKGYPATYSHFRNLTAADSTIVKLNNQIRVKELPVIDLDRRTTQTKERTEEIIR